MANGKLRGYISVQNFDLDRWELWFEYEEGERLQVHVCDGYEELDRVRTSLTTILPHGPERLPGVMRGTGLVRRPRQGG